jgi:hypothetical protein
VCAQKREDILRLVGHIMAGGLQSVTAIRIATTVISLIDRPVDKRRKGR